MQKQGTLSNPLLHQFDRWARCLRRHLLHRHLDRTQFGVHIDIIIRLDGSILNHDSGKVGTISMILGVEDDGTAAAALLRASKWPATRALIGRDRDRSRRVYSHRLRGVCLQVRERNRKVTSVDFLVWRVLVANHPAVRRGRRRGNKEQLVNLGRLEKLLMLAFVHERGWLAKVDSWAHVSVQQAGVLKHLADGDCVVFTHEGADDAAHGWEGGEGVQTS